MAQVRVIKFVCDNCDAPIENESDATTVTLRVTGESVGYAVDLCAACGPRIRTLANKGQVIRSGRPGGGAAAREPRSTTGRKRGRPSKADLAAREAQARVAASAEQPTPVTGIAPETPPATPTYDPAFDTAAQAQAEAAPSSPEIEPEAERDDGVSIVSAAPSGVPVPTFSHGGTDA